MSCDHKEVRIMPGMYDDWSGETGPDHAEEYSTFEDIDLHRMKCTKCGEIKYYSEKARQHFEEGKSFDWIDGLK